MSWWLIREMHQKSITANPETTPPEWVSARSWIQSPILFAVQSVAGGTTDTEEQTDQKAHERTEEVCGWKIGGGRKVWTKRCQDRRQKGVEGDLPLKSDHVDSDVIVLLECTLTFSIILSSFNRFACSTNCEMKKQSVIDHWLTTPPSSLTTYWPPSPTTLTNTIPTTTNPKRPPALPTTSTCSLLPKNFASYPTNPRLNVGQIVSLALPMHGIENAWREKKKGGECELVGERSANDLLTITPTIPKPLPNRLLANSFRDKNVTDHIATAYGPSRNL